MSSLSRVPFFSPLGALFVGTVGLLLLSGCGSTSPVTAPPAAATVPAGGDVSSIDPEVLELRALLLLMSDRRLYEPVAVGSAVDHADPELRRQAALALGRVRDPRAVGALRLLLVDDVAKVRRAAAFALGELGRFGAESVQAPLLGAVADPDRETGVRAVEALGRSGVPLERIVERLVTAPPDEIVPRLAPSLFRFDGVGIAGWAAQGLESDDPEVHRMAAYGLSREPVAENLDALRALLADADPWVRAGAARAVGLVGDRSDIERLRPLLDDAEGGPVVRALGAARALVADGRASAPDAWKPRLLDLLDDPRPGVRLAAIEASAAWLFDEAIGERLERFLSDGAPRERELALVALAEASSPRAAVWLPRLAKDEVPTVRAAAAQAAALLGESDLVLELSGDPTSRVRRTAVEVLLELDPDAETAATALRDPDSAVRAVVLGWATERPVLPLEILAVALVTARADRNVDARLAAVDAIVARAEAEPTERGTLVEVLEKAAEWDDYLVRRAASQGLAQLGRPVPAVGTVDTGRDIGTYREIVRQILRPARVEMVTERGAIELEILCPEAPLTCLSFLQLARQGYFDDLPFHRIVPDFVVQGGDPKGDGFGGPGYSLRDEPNLLRYDRGTIGMARLGPDTGGSQFFLALSAQPHLDGDYTAFGRAIRGLEVLDDLVQGDRLLRVTVLGEGAPGEAP